jgi:hypothetical protein
MLGETKVYHFSLKSFKKIPEKNQYKATFAFDMDFFGSGNRLEDTFCAFFSVNKPSDQYSFIHDYWKISESEASLLMIEPIKEELIAILDELKERILLTELSYTFPEINNIRIKEFHSIHGNLLPCMEFDVAGFSYPFQMNLFPFEPGHLKFFQLYPVLPDWDPGFLYCHPDTIFFHEYVFDEIKPFLFSHPETRVRLSTMGKLRDHQSDFFKEMKERKKKNA